MDIFTNIFGGTMLLGAVLFIVFLYQTIKNEALKIKNEKLKDTFDDVIEIAFRTVLNLTQTTVKELKETGKWDTGMARGIFNQALQEVKYQLGQESLELLKEKVTDVDLYLTNLIESIVYETKMNAVEGIDIDKLLKTIHDEMKNRIDTNTDITKVDKVD